MPRGRTAQVCDLCVVALNNLLSGVENFVKVLSWRIGEVISDEEFSQLYSAWLPLADTEVRNSVLSASLIVFDVAAIVLVDGSRCRRVIKSLLRT